MKAQTIYKLLPRAEWEAAQAAGVYRGSEHDRRDGFIHFSTAAQLAETARKYFTGVRNLVLLAVAPLGTDVQREAEYALKWEPSRSGDLFPHLYADMPVSAVTGVFDITLGDNGVPTLPADLPS